MNLIEAEILKNINAFMSCGFLDAVFVFISTLGNKGAIWIAFTIILLAFPKTRKAGLCTATALILSLVIGNVVLKPLFARTRPYDFDNEIVPIIKMLGDYSFPSGHTMAAFAFVSALDKYCERLKTAMYVFAVLMGFSRIYLCMHYPSDVIFGAVFGICFGMLAHLLIRKVGKKL